FLPRAVTTIKVHSSPLRLCWRWRVGWLMTQATTTRHGITSPGRSISPKWAATARSVLTSSAARAIWRSTDAEPLRQSNWPFKVERRYREGQDDRSWKLDCSRCMPEVWRPYDALRIASDSSSKPSKCSTHRKPRNHLLGSADSMKRHW